MRFGMVVAAAQLSLVMTACTSTTTDDTGYDGPRGAFGKVDLIGSCVDSGCDGAAVDGNCWCDDDCFRYGDCCEDRVAECGALTCGGFAGLACPAGLECVDDPNDGCDPSAGGADCAGICQPPATQACGGLLGLQCDAGELCDYELEDICGAADQTGVCKPQPEFCAEIYSPVCGCDGVTYSNECFANAAGTSISAVGECTSACEDAGNFCTSSTVCPADTVASDLACGGGQTCCQPWQPAGDRDPVEGVCIRNSNDACETDADCFTGGCGGELCYNPALGGGFTTCDCTAPTTPTGCGCVAGQCTWYAQ